MHLRGIIGKTKGKEGKLHITECTLLSDGTWERRITYPHVVKTRTLRITPFLYMYGTDNAPLPVIRY